MSRPISRPAHKNTNRRKLLDELWHLGRKISTQTVFLHQAIAQTVGLNATDTKCVDLILTHPGARMTAGELSQKTGLTTGAITHILDRLEKRRFIVRTRDPRDLRRVFIAVRPESLEPLIPEYEETGKAFTALAEEYGDRELAVISDYMHKACAISEQELARMVRRDPRQRRP